LPLILATRMPTTNGRFLLFSLIAAILAGLLFASGLPGDFVFDDIPNIVNNEPLKLTTLDLDALHKVIFSYQMSGTMRVLPTLSFALDHWRAGGMDPAAFKLTNIVIHALTTCALAFFLRSLLLISGLGSARARWAALALAFAWAAHPLQVSAVLYVVQRMQTMGTLFLVLALWAYLQARQAQINGQSGRTGLLVAFLMWILAMGCKEDTVLLPAYTLAMELTVLRFRAADTRLATGLRRGYLLATLAGAAGYLFVVVPHYWTSDAYNGRTFSTPERLLTQARVLCMYLWQIIVPLPQHMPFYYDGLQPSRGLLQPWTTLPSIAVVLGLLAAAWRVRLRWPLFALGVFLFFSAHFIASNVVGVELAFEHRNHFALVGAVLAVGCLLAYVANRLHVRPIAGAALCGVMLVALGGATIMRAKSWNGTLTLARTSTEVAPDSARAWVSLCAGYFEAGGRAKPGNPRLDDAIDACTAGSMAAPYSLNSPALLIVLKTLRGDVTPMDWDSFQQRLETVPMTFDNRRAPQILVYHAMNGVKIDRQRLLTALDTLVDRAPLHAMEFASMGYAVMNEFGDPDRAVHHFAKAIENANPIDPFPQQIQAELIAKGRPDLAEKLRKISEARWTGAAAPRTGNME